jgi:hypothetical protein
MNKTALGQHKPTPHAPLERTKGGACDKEFPLNRVGHGADGRKARAYLVTIIIITPRTSATYKVQVLTVKHHNTYTYTITKAAPSQQTTLHTCSISSQQGLSLASIDRTTLISTLTHLCHVEGVGVDFLALHLLELPHVSRLPINISRTQGHPAGHVRQHLMVAEQNTADNGQQQQSLSSEARSCCGRCTIHFSWTKGHPACHVQQELPEFPSNTTHLILWPKVMPGSY